MTWDICVIDDSIPVTGELEVDDTASLDTSILKLLLEKNTWGEDAVKDLFNELCSDSENWNVLAFTNPDFYLQTSEAHNYKPDIIIFDWDYPVVADGDISKTLLRVVRNSFSLVYVYTREDKEEEVTRELSKDIFNEFRDKRLFVLHKWDPEPEQTLLQNAKQKYEANFAFRFGSLLRRASTESVEKVLIELGGYHIDFVKDFLAESETKETDIKALLAEKIATSILENEGVLEELAKEDGMDKNKAQNLLDIIKSKFRDEIKSTDFNLLGSETSRTADAASLKELWSYRLYYHPSDAVVRTGDIIKNKRTKKCFLVVTPDCNLNMFWHKSFGHVNLIPLLEITAEGDKIKDYLSLTRKPDGDGGVKKTIKKTSPTSVCNTPKDYPNGCFVLPFVDYAGVYFSFMGFSCALTSIKIKPRPLNGGETPKDRKGELLGYRQWNNFERIATISEPFLAPIIQNAFGAISGQGTPDYPHPIQQAIRQEFMSIYND